MMHFVSLQSVEEQALRTINNILSRKQLLTPEKFDSIMKEYERKQAKLDAEVSAGIKNQIENIQIAKKNIEQAKDKMSHSLSIENINRFWKQEQQLHESFPEISRLLTYKNNIGTVINQLQNFVDLESSLNNIKQLMKDQTNFQSVNSKIMDLIDLRDNVIKKLEGDRSSKEVAIIKKEFQELETIEKKFYDSVFQKFTNCIYIAKTNPISLITMANIVEVGDRMLIEKNKEPFMKQNAISKITNFLNKKCDQLLSGKNNIIEIIQKANFVTLDLIDVLDYVTRCFPKQFKIFQLFQSVYQKNIEKYVNPQFQKMKKQSNYGDCLVLMNWIEDYEDILERAGVSSDSYITLKCNIKQILPKFIDHNKQLLSTFICNCRKQDQSNYERQSYQRMIRQQDQFVTNFPSDVFSFVNKHAQIVKVQVRGELFIEFIRCIATELKDIQELIRKQIEEQFIQEIQNTVSEDRIVDFQYKVILNLNNYNQCLRYANQAKTEYMNMVPEKYQERVNKIFLNQVQKQFNQSIPVFVNIIVKVIYLDITKKEITNFFTPKWAERQSIMQLILQTVNSELLDIQNIINNPINYRLLVKGCYQYIMDIYIQELINTVKVAYGLSMKDWKPLLLKGKQIQTKNKKILNKNILAENINKDIRILVDFADEMSSHLNKNYIKTKIQDRMGLVKDMFTKNNVQFEGLLQTIVSTFLNSKQLVEIAVCTRQQLSKSYLSKVEEMKSKVKEGKSKK